MIHHRPQTFARRFLPLTAHCLLPTVLLLLTAHCSQLTVFGQSSTATLSGTVTDPNGALVSGATVTATDPETRLQRTTTTNDEGQFVIPLLPPSKYNLTLERQGFMTAEVRDIVLNVNDELALAIKMKVGDISETVNVTGEATLISESPAVGTVVDRQFVGNLPLNGRSFQSLITLSPGVVLTKANASEQGQFSVNGQRADANYFTVDGVSANIGVTATFTPGQSSAGSIPGFSATGGTNNLVSVDALQEFKIQTSTYAPEFGRTPGAQVSIVTRSGTNKFRGAVFEYLRNDKVDANDWFGNSRSLKRPALRQNDFGGVLGGPIIKDRTFFFFSYEGLRLRQPVVAITDVPSISARQKAPATVQSYLNAFPIPTGPDKINPATGLPTGFAEFAAGFSDQATLNAASIRVDHTVNKKLTLFGRYSYAPSETVQRRGGGAFSLNNLNPASFRTETVTVGTTLFIKPTITNELLFNYSKNRGSSTFIVDNFGGATVPPDSALFPSFTSAQAAQFTLLVSGGTNSAFTAGQGARNVQRQINLVNNLSITAKSHQLKFGIDYRRLTPVVNPRAYVQSYSFVGIGITAPGVPPPAGSALSGRASSVSIQAQQDRVVPVYDNFSAYAQDTWKASQRLTLTYGLRWEVNPPPREQNGNDALTVIGLENPATLTLAPRGTPLWKTTHNNFAPRIGVAYQLFQGRGRETVLRGGFGIFYDLGTGQSGNAFTLFPFVARKSLVAVLLPLTSDQLAPPSLDPNRPVDFLNVSVPNLKLPYTYQWNVTVEQSLGLNQTLSASYVGAAGRRLLRQEQLFGSALGGSLNPAVFAPVSFVQVTRNQATSDYHSFQLQFQRRLKRGLQALASYAWSKSLDNVSEDSSNNVPGAKIDPQLDRGPSTFDVRHSFNAGITYNIPAPKLGSIGRAILQKWAVDSTITARSATPVNVVVQRNIGFGSFGFRPDLVQGVPLYLNDSTVAGGKRINVGAFSIPTSLRQGTLGRNALRGFSVYQMDLAIRRQFNLTESINLQFRAEFFNVFNHPNFADPVGVLGTLSGSTFFPQSTFGTSQTMLNRSLGTGGSLGGFNPLYQIGGPRSIQLALKLNF